MTSSQFQEQAHSFASYGNNPMYAYLGLAEEAGEVCGKVAKFIRHNEGLTPQQAEDGFPHALKEELSKFRTDIRKELGDVLWFVAEVATLNGLTLEGLMDSNIAKLRDRKNRGVIDGSGDDR